MNKTTINTTATAAVNAKFPAKYYDRQLLESAKTRFVHAEFGQKRPIPRNSGKYVNFRRWNLFDPETAISGLVEGETPTGQTLSQTDVEAEVKQYGAYVEVSDLLDLTAYDEVINDSAELLGEQLGTVVEWINVCRQQRSICRRQSRQKCPDERRQADDDRNSKSGANAEKEQSAPLL